MRYAIAHDLHLRFEAPVWEHHCEVRLAPQETAEQTVADVSVSVDPAAEVYGYTDCFGNRVHAFGVIAPHTELRVRMRASVGTSLTNPFDFSVVPPARQTEWLHENLRAQPRLWDYVMHRSACTPPVAALAEHGLTPPAHVADRPVLDAVVAAMDWIEEVLEYTPAFPTAARPLADALAAGAGGCQDLAHLLVSVVRGWGIPARYVAGYRDPGYAEEAPQSLHAWAEVLVPGAGWRGVDPAAHLVANETYVTVALGRDATDAVPLKSHYKGGEPPAETALELEVTRDQ